MQLLPGDTVTIYKDWENQVTPIGEAILVRRVSEGLSFILEDTHPDGEPISDNRQIVYASDKWVVDFFNLTDYGRYYYGLRPPVEKLHRVRYIYNQGLTIPNNISSPYKPKRIRLQEDKFTNYNGRESF